MFGKILDYIKSYVVIEVDCDYHERFINLCVRDDLLFWEATKTLAGCSLKTTRSNIKPMREIAKKLGIKLEVVDEKGLFYLLKKYKNRYMFLIGAVLFVAFIFIMSSFIWSVEIVGCERVSEDLVRSELLKREIRPGVLATKVDSETISDELRIAIPELSWVALNRRGSKLFVELKERTDKPQIADNLTPSNLVATADGVITALEIAKGQQLVKVGDVVKAGDILVSGTIKSETKEVRYTASRGRVMAKTWTKISSTSPAFSERNIYSGREKALYSLRIFDSNINLYIKSGISYPEYDKIINISEAKLGENFYLPFGIVKERFLECEAARRPLSYEEQLAICRARRDELFAVSFPAAAVSGALEEVVASDEGLTLLSEVVSVMDIASVGELIP